jgi:hypothetical protein
MYPYRSKVNLEPVRCLYHDIRLRFAIISYSHVYYYASKLSKSVGTYSNRKKSR